MLIFSESLEKPVSVTLTSNMKKGELFKMIKNLRFRDVTRITHQEQLDDRCPVTYEGRLFDFFCLKIIFENFNLKI